jgi:hypothetical protein
MHMRHHEMARRPVRHIRAQRAALLQLHGTEGLGRLWTPTRAIGGLVLGLLIGAGFVIYANKRYPSDATD